MNYLNKIVNDYYKNIMFLFTPNICNANCYFCFVKPIYRDNNCNIPNHTLSKLEKLLQLAKKYNFKEIRITGGEPLIFENLRELIQYIIKLNLEYSILTNGLELKKYIPFFLEKRPKKISVSLHSLKNLNEIFRKEVNMNDLLEGIYILRKNKIDITISIVFLPENKEEIVELIHFLAKKELKNFKVIFPTFLENSLKEEFIEIRRKLVKYFKELDIRITNIYKKECLLKQRGFLSITLPEFKVYNCCTLVSVDNIPFKIEKFSEGEFKEILSSFYRKRLKFSLEKLCNTSFCPIALEYIKFME